MTSAFGLLDVPTAAVILFAIVAPKRFYQASKFPEQHAAIWRPRVRPLGVAALVLWVASRLVMLYLFPQFEQLIRF